MEAMDFREDVDAFALRNYVLIMYNWNKISIS